MELLGLSVLALGAVDFCKVVDKGGRVPLSRGLSSAYPSDKNSPARPPPRAGSWSCRIRVQLAEGASLPRGLCFHIAVRLARYSKLVSPALR